jgi:hypothetical protein
MGGDSQLFRRSSDKPAGGHHDPSPAAELTALLWIVAGLLGVLDTLWWFSNRVFSP